LTVTTLKIWQNCGAFCRPRRTAQQALRGAHGACHSSWRRLCTSNQPVLAGNLPSRPQLRNPFFEKISCKSKKTVLRASTCQPEKISDQPGIPLFPGVNGCYRPGAAPPHTLPSPCFAPSGLLWRTLVAGIRYPDRWKALLYSVVGSGGCPDIRGVGGDGPEFPEPELALITANSNSFTIHSQGRPRVLTTPRPFTHTRA
jgi:hypothetical protein